MDEQGCHGQIIHYVTLLRFSKVRLWEDINHCQDNCDPVSWSHYCQQGLLPDKASNIQAEEVAWIYCSVLGRGFTVSQSA